MYFACQLGQGQNETYKFFGQLGHKNFFKVLKVTQNDFKKCKKLHLHIIIYPYIDTSIQYNAKTIDLRRRTLLFDHQLFFLKYQIGTMKYGEIF